jgi:hypothetical protein
MRSYLKEKVAASLKKTDITTLGALSIMNEQNERFACHFKKQRSILLEASR